MSGSSSFGNVEINLTTAGKGDTSSPRRDDEFRVVILGDFSGRRHRGLCDAETAFQAPPIFIDRDNFDRVMEQLAVQLSLKLANSAPSTHAIRIRQLDDFHPDRIYQQVELFSSLRALRRRLLNRDTFAQAAAELMAGSEPARKAPVAEAADEPARELPDNLLDAALEATEDVAATDQSTSGSPLIDRLIQEVVAPHVIPAADPRQPELVASVDAAITDQMRGILHHPDFQSLEAIWRGLFFLVRRLETDAHLKLFLVDVSKQELAGDLTGHDDLSRTAIYRTLVEPSVGTAGGRPWSLLLGDYYFDSSPEDVAVLGRMAKVAAQAGAPIIAAARPAVAGCESFATSPDPDQWQSESEMDREQQDAWSALRQLPEARFVALALPRFPLRLPFGAKSDRIESFDFEELAVPPGHEEYLWGNPAWACAWRLADSFVQFGWDFTPGSPVTLDRLPLHVYKIDDEPRIQPCAEAWLTDRAARQLAEQGLTPLVSVQNSDTVQIGAIRSLADPPALLAGGWNEV